MTTLHRQGPAGGIGTPTSPPPVPFDAQPPQTGGPWKISRIRGRSDNSVDGAIHQLSLVWESTTDGATFSSPAFGSPGGDSFDIPIETGDFVTHLEGYIGRVPFPNPTSPLSFLVVQGLFFRTRNGMAPDARGTETPHKFTYDSPEGFHIVGFFGLMGGLIDALGVYLQEIP